MARKCAFCENRANTREHVWPDWIIRRFETGQFEHRHQAVSDKHGQLADLLWEGPKIDLKVRRVCRSCNEGWMSRAEVAIEPLLSDLIFNPSRPRILSIEDTSRLALWIAKTMLVFQFLNHEGATVPRESYEFVREHQLPPPGMRIWIAGLDDVDGTLYRHHRLRLTGSVSGRQGHGYSATFGIRHFAFQVIAHNIGDEVSFTRNDEERYSLPIWPNSESVSWPPAFFFTREGWSEWADAIVSHPSRPPH